MAGSPCIPSVFLYNCFGHRKKRHLAPSPPTVDENTPFDPKISKKNSGGGTSPSPDLSAGGEGDTPSPHLTHRGARLGSRLWRSTLAPNLNSWIVYAFKEI